MTTPYEPPLLVVVETTPDEATEQDMDHPHAGELVFQKQPMVRYELRERSFYTKNGMFNELHRLICNHNRVGLCSIGDNGAIVVTVHDPAHFNEVVAFVEGIIKHLWATLKYSDAQPCKITALA